MKRKTGRKSNREATALAAANKQCYLWLLIGAAFGAILFLTCTLGGLNNSHQAQAEHERPPGAPSEGGPTAFPGPTPATPNIALTNGNTLITAP